MRKEIVLLMDAHTEKALRHGSTRLIVALSLRHVLIDRLLTTLFARSLLAVHDEWHILQTIRHIHKRPSHLSRHQWPRRPVTPPLQAKESKLPKLAESMGWKVCESLFLSLNVS